MHLWQSAHLQLQLSLCSHYCCSCELPAAAAHTAAAVTDAVVTAVDAAAAGCCYCCRCCAAHMLSVTESEPTSSGGSALATALRASAHTCMKQQTKQERAEQCTADLRMRPAQSVPTGQQVFNCLLFHFVCCHCCCHLHLSNTITSLSSPSTSQTRANHCSSSRQPAVLPSRLTLCASLLRIAYTCPPHSAYFTQCLCVSVC
jgi:hypothetical protein